MELLSKKIVELERKMASPEGASDVTLFVEYDKLKQVYQQKEKEWELVFIELSELKEL